GEQVQRPATERLDGSIGGEPSGHRPGLFDGAADGDEGLIVVLQIHIVGKRDLLEVGEAGRLARALARLRADGEENGGENRDYCDHNEQFDERESTTGHEALLSHTRRVWRISQREDKRR